MKNKIIKEIKDFYFETGQVPRYCDLSFSRYLVKKYVGDPRSVLKIEKRKYSKVYLPPEPSLEQQIEWFALTHLRMPTASDCGKGVMSSYSKFKKELGGINSAPGNVFFDNIRAILRSRKEILSEQEH